MALCAGRSWSRATCCRPASPIWGGAMQPTERRVLSSVTLVLLTAPWGWSAGAQTTERVSVTSGGTEGNGASLGSALSADGRFVAFDSAATDLVAGDTNGVSDVFVHDRQTGTTGRVSVASGGTQGNDSSAGPVLSADGGLVGSTARRPTSSPATRTARTMCSSTS